MIHFIAQRILFGLVTLWVASVLVFMGTDVLPGDVATAILGQNATPEAIEVLREQLGLDRPRTARYLDWFFGLLHGDMGTSLVSNKPVATVIGTWANNTFILAGFTALIAVPISLILALLCASFQNTVFDRSVSISSLVIVSVPEFLTAFVLVLLIAVNLQLLPATSRLIGASPDYAEQLRVLILPMATLTLGSVAYLTRMIRAAVISVLRSSYVEMAILKGLPNWRIILIHALPNAVAPILNAVALVLGYLVSGVVVVEAVFAYPGLGRLLLDSVGFRDYPVVQALAMLFTGFYIGINLLVDVLVILLNPRLGEQR